MSYSFVLSETATFNVTHARHMAAKVATDLKRVQRFYGVPTDSAIAAYEAEIIELLNANYLGTVTYGFKRNSNWVEPTLRYTARALAGTGTSDDDPGRVRPGADISGAIFHSYLTYSSGWDNLSSTEKDNFRRRLPFQRQGAIEPGISGYFHDDRTYSTGGRALYRASVRSFG